MSPMAKAVRIFWRKGGARFGVALLGTFLLLAIYAPFLYGDIAIVWWDGQGLHFPLFTDLFNQQSYPNPHSLLFNLLVFLAPAFLLAWWLTGRFLGWSDV